MVEFGFKALFRINKLERNEEAIGRRNSGLGGGARVNPPPE